MLKNRNNIPWQRPPWKWEYSKCNPRWWINHPLWQSGHYWRYFKIWARVNILRRSREATAKDFPLGVTDYGRFERSNIGYWKDKEQRLAQAKEEWATYIATREAKREEDRQNEALR